MFLGACRQVLELPYFFKALDTVHDSCDLSNESQRKATSGASTSEMKHGFLPFRFLMTGALAEASLFYDGALQKSSNQAVIESGARWTSELLETVANRPA